jgi:hypothetical protein
MLGNILKAITNFWNYQNVLKYWFTLWHFAMDDPVVCMTECKKSEWWSKLPSRHEIEFLLLLPLSFSSFHSLLCALSWECALWEENSGPCTNNSYFPIFFPQCTLWGKATESRMKRAEVMWVTIRPFLVEVICISKQNWNSDYNSWRISLSSGKVQLEILKCWSIYLVLLNFYSRNFVDDSERPDNSLINIWIPQKPNYNLAFRSKIGHV